MRTPPFHQRSINSRLCSFNISSVNVNTHGVFSVLGGASRRLSLRLEIRQSQIMKSPVLKNPIDSGDAASVYPATAQRNPIPASSPRFKRAAGSSTSTSNHAMNIGMHLDPHGLNASLSPGSVKKQRIDIGDVDKSHEQYQLQTMVSPKRLDAEKAKQAESSAAVHRDVELDVPPIKQVDDAERIAKTARHTLTTLKATIDGSLDILQELKMHEINIEEELVIQGTHPEYIQGIKDIETKRAMAQQHAMQRLGIAVKANETQFDAQVKIANDTMQTAKRETVSKLLVRLVEALQVFQREYRMSGPQLEQSK